MWTPIKQLKDISNKLFVGQRVHLKLVKLSLNLYWTDTAKFPIPIGYDFGLACGIGHLSLCYCQ